MLLGTLFLNNFVYLNLQSETFFQKSAPFIFRPLVGWSAAMRPSKMPGSRDRRPAPPRPRSQQQFSGFEYYAYLGLWGCVKKSVRFSTWVVAGVCSLPVPLRIQARGEERHRLRLRRDVGRASPELQGWVWGRITLSSLHCAFDLISCIAWVLNILIKDRLILFKWKKFLLSMVNLTFSTKFSRITL